MHSKLNILLTSSQVLTTPPSKYGGTEEVVANLAKGLADRGHEVTVASAKGSEQEFRRRFPKCNVEFIEGYPPLEGTEYDLAELYKDRIDEFDVVNHHGWSDAPHRLRKDVFHTIHGPYPGVMSKSRSIALSEGHRQHLMRTQPVDDCYFVYNGIDVDRYPYQEEKGDYLLYLARVDKSKGALDFIDICRRTGERGIIAGDDSLISDYRYVEEVIYQVDMCDDVDYLGEVSREYASELLRGAKALVAPLSDTWVEPFGLVYVEAQLSGCPVLVRKSGSTPEVVKHDVSGFALENLDDFPEYVHRLDEIKPEDCRNYAEKFNINQMAKDYEKVYGQGVA